MNLQKYVSFFLLCFALTGCGPKGVSDQTLATDIQAKLYADPVTKSANVKVAVNNGVVTLTGDAPNSDTALQAVNIANGTSGIKSVDNQVKVAPPVAPAQTASSTPPPTPQNMQPPPPTPQNMQPPAPVDDTKHAPPPPPMERPRPRAVTIPVGTDLAVRMIDSISSKTNQAGQTFRASLDAPVTVNGETVIPVGAPVSILLDHAKGAGRIKGSSELEVRAVSIEHHGRTYNIETNVHEEEGKGRGKQTAVRTGVGAAAGTIIGAIAGGGKGAGIGALAGGGAGAGFQLFTHGQQVSIPSETQLNFRLTAPVTL
jgi:hypothetical protein